MPFTCPEGCGQCCGLMMFDLPWWEKHKHETVREAEVKVFGDIAVPTQKGHTELGCVFLTTQKKCSVYEDRPPTCRNYGIDPRYPCPILRPDGTRRSKEEKRETKAKIGAQVDDFLAYGKMLQQQEKQKKVKPCPTLRIGAT